MKYEELLDIIANSNPDDWQYDDDLGLYVFVQDVDITIVSDRTWPNENGFDDDCRFYEVWAEQFPDPNAYRRRYLIKYRGATIKAFYTAMVDGARCHIPYPRRTDMTITQQQYGIGYIINVLPCHCDYDYYIRQSGIKII